MVIVRLSSLKLVGNELCFEKYSNERILKWLSLAKTKMTEVESKIADACDKMKGFEKKES